MRLMLLSLCAGVCLAAAGCASTPTTVARAATDDCGRIDCAKIARVSAVARQRGIAVIWVNPPAKPVAASGS